ncbi:hypothetical protein L1987_31273 [Smallanthus sonchifolius]|uniref:Uncharacterized protein n=1 Tax=Smallanthus sonchifolius TaxID=185202 RepID=A0ACB9I4H5_9ASTR|nr:hypothetical protein L1987_31273 [Smallanthus sonchifolius]
MTSSARQLKFWPSWLIPTSRVAIDIKVATVMDATTELVHTEVATDPSFMVHVALPPMTSLARQLKFWPSWLIPTSRVAIDIKVATVMDATTELVHTEVATDPSFMVRVALPPMTSSARQLKFWPSWLIPTSRVAIDIKVATVMDATTELVHTEVATDPSFMVRVAFPPMTSSARKLKFWPSWLIPTSRVAIDIKVATVMDATTELVHTEVATDPSFMVRVALPPMTSSARQLKFWPSWLIPTSRVAIDIKVATVMDATTELVHTEVATDPRLLLRLLLTCSYYPDAA